MGASQRPTQHCLGDWFAAVAASLKSLPDLNSPEWPNAFGDLTLWLRFDDDDDDGKEQCFDSSQDLPDALDCSHKAASRAMAKHRSPAVPGAKGPVTPALAPIIVKTVDKLPACPSARPIVHAPREPMPPTTRESSPSPPREPAPDDILVSCREPLNTVTRLPRETNQESAPTRLSPPILSVFDSQPNPTLGSVPITSFETTWIKSTQAKDPILWPLTKKTQPFPLLK